MRIITPVLVFLFACGGAFLALTLLMRLQVSWLHSQLAHDDYVGRLAVYSVSLPINAVTVIAGCLGVVSACWLMRVIEKAVTNQ
jgi:hypothetical protein